MDEQSELIKKFLKEGKDRKGVRNELISLGHSTQGFDEMFNTVLREEKMEEPKSLPYGEYVQKQEEGILRETTLFSRMVPAAKMLLLSVLLLAIVIFVGTLLFSELSTPAVSSEEEIEWGKQAVEEKDMSLNFNDSILQTKVESTVASANVHGGRMGSYDGVCSDITVVPPVACYGTSAAYAIFAPMSNGTYYCVDTSGFRDLVDTRPAEGGVCVQ